MAFFLAVAGTHPMVSTGKSQIPVKRLQKQCYWILPCWDATEYQVPMVFETCRYSLQNRKSKCNTCELLIFSTCVIKILTNLSPFISTVP